MSKTMQVATTITVPGITPYARTVTLESANDVETEISVAAANAGTLTTRTDANTGTLTMGSAGHGITTGSRISIFWDGGSRVNVVVGTVSGTSVPFDLGSGDDLPVATTVITAMNPQEESVVFTGDNAVSAFVYSSLQGTDTYNGYAVFCLTDDTVVATFKVTPDLPSNSWDGADVATNPFAGAAVTKVQFTQGNTSAITMGSVVLYD